MNLTSTALAHNDTIPPRYTCDGEDVHPELHISGVPPQAKTLALIMDDPDAPRGTWLHWTVWNIPPTTRTIAEGTIPAGVTEGTTSFGRSGYGGPCPHAGMHHYFFKLYALDTVLDLPSGASLEDLTAAMDGHILARAELVGLYKRG